MKVREECIACVEKQARNTLAYHHAGTEVTDAVVAEVRKQLVEIDWSQTPADLSNIAYRSVEKHFTQDAYADAKRRQNRLALSLYPQLKQMVDEARDRLWTAIRIAATGNVIDLGIGLQINIPQEVKTLLHAPFPVDHTETLREKLQQAKRILYVGDNAGEIVFDRVLIEELVPEHELTFVVRGGPVINDATLEDAEAVGMTSLVPVITTGSNRIGTPWPHMSQAFREHYHAADLIISKGQGNYETLSERDDKDIFFILRAKCEVIARELGVNHLDLIMKYQPVRVAART